MPWYVAWWVSVFNMPTLPVEPTYVCFISFRISGSC